MRLTMIPPETPTTELLDIGKILAYCAAPFLLIMQFIKMYFKDKAEERETFIKSVVKEVMETAMIPIKEEMKKMSDRYEENNKYIHERINKIIQKQ